MRPDNEGFLTRFVIDGVGVRVRTDRQLEGIERARLRALLVSSASTVVGGMKLDAYPPYHWQRLRGPAT